MTLTLEDLHNLERRFRANLMNSMLGYKPANLVGSISQEGNTNLTIFNSALHLGANPPLIALLSRPETVERHTLENIRARKVYTINHVGIDFYQQAHQTSAKYEKHVSEFEQTNLGTEYRMGFEAPFVKESQLGIGLELRELHPIKLNGTILIIGEVQLIKIEEEYILEDGSIDFELLNTVSVTGLDTYHQATQLQKLPYARP